MEPAHERSLRQMARQLRKDPRGAFVLAACSDQALREQLERRLANELGPEFGLEILEWPEHPTAPWDEIQGARQRQGERAVVSVHYDAIEPPALDPEHPDQHAQLPDDDRNALLRLNLGRDIRAREAIALVLWVRGPGALESLRTSTPDLWAHRTLAVHFPSVHDFPIQRGEDLEARHLDLRREIEYHLEKATQEWTSPQGRIVEFSAAARLLYGSNQIEKMSHVVDDMHRLYDSNVDLQTHEISTWNVWIRRLQLSDAQGDRARCDESTARIAEIARVSGWLSLAVLSILAKGTNLHDRGFVEEYLDTLNEGLRLTTSPSLLWQNNTVFALVDRGCFFARIGDPLRARSDLELAARSSTKRVDQSRRQDPWIRIEMGRADCSALLGHPSDALRPARRSAQRMTMMGQWDGLPDILDRGRELYIDLGLPGLARAEFLATPGQLWLRDLPMVRSKIEAHLARLMLAIGDHSMSEHARAHLTLLLDVSHLHPTAKLLECSRFSRQVYPQWDDPSKLDTWPSQLDDQLATPLDDDARDRLSLERARWYLLTHDAKSAISLADGTLPFRREHRGPLLVAASCITAAQGYRELRAFDRAAERLAEARAVIEQIRDEARPFDDYKEVMLETARLAEARADPETAWRAIDDALAFATRRRLKVERMRLLLEQARLEPGSSRGRDAAHRSLQIASELGYLRDEGQIRLELARQAEHAGDLDQARTELAEAQWLLERLGPPDRRDEARALAQRLA